MLASPRRVARLMSLLVLLSAAGCAERPTEPRQAARRPLAQLNQYGESPLVVGSTVRGIALLQVGLAGEEQPRWEFKNEQPEEQEAWGGIALAAGEKYELSVRGFDVEGRERFSGSLVVPVGEEIVAQVRGEATLEGEPTEADKAAGAEVYAGSYRVAASPRWLDLSGDDVGITVAVHDALGERLELEPKDLDAFLDPKIGTLEVTYGDRELRELVLKMHPYYEELPPDPVPPIKLCVLGDLSCSPVNLRTAPNEPNGSIYLKVVANENHTCALRGNFVALCWGDDGAVQGGFNGSGLTGHFFLDIDTNMEHSCGVETTGVASCWGALWAAAGQSSSR